MKRLLLVTAMCLVAIAGVSNVASASYQVLYVNGILNLTEGMIGWGTTGNEMAGMSVFATFSDNTWESVAWIAEVPFAGRASGTGWNLYENGDTYTEEWSLSNLTGKTLKTLVIDAKPGNCVFDTEHNVGPDGYGTAGTFLGRAFNPRYADQVDLTMTATYYDEVALDANPVPVGDIYRYLKIDFDGVGFASGRALRYLADTDELNHAGDLTPVPEPGSVLLTAAGILGLLAFRRRRRS